MQNISNVLNPIATDALPLAGVLVLELGQRVGTSVCGSLLAQLGAEVVFVESTPIATGAETKLSYRPTMAAGKRSLALDEQAECDVALVKQLAKRADVVLLASDFRADGQRKSWLPMRPGYQIECDITAFGWSGPYAGQDFSDRLVQAISGVMHSTGFPDGPPVPIEFPLLEFMTGAYATAAVLAALRFRRRTGKGQAIDMTLYDCAFHAMATFLPHVLIGSTTTAHRVGNRHTMSSPWNVYRARDGWVLICAASDVQWQRLCAVMGRPDLVTRPSLARLSDRVAHNEEVDAAVQNWVSTISTAESIEALGKASIACGPIAEIDGYPRERNLDHRGMVLKLRDPHRGRDVFVPASPLRMSRTPGASPRTIPAVDADRVQLQERLRSPELQRPATIAKTDAAPLSGVRVVEIGHYTTAPLAARHLASLGAEVIKIEPPGGEAMRGWPPLKCSQGVFFTYTNADKKSVVLDLRREEDVTTLKRLLTSADVLIENLKPGALAERGFTRAALLELNPRLIYCAISGFGYDSLYVGRPAFDTVIQAMSGIMDLIRSNDMPLKSGPSSADIMGGEVAVVAILAALEHRDDTGKGQWIDLSMQDIAAWLTQTRWNGAARGHTDVLLECCDGFLFAVGTSSNLARIEATGRASDTRAQRQAALASIGVCAAPVSTPAELAAHPQTKARGLWAQIRTSGGEIWPLLGSPLCLKATPPIVSRPMGPLDQDRDAVLNKWLGPSQNPTN
jgi:crotonobetainyl-CoA:carnitine CoA-transferase CaiB-like acyl-CoA transferase